MTMITMKNIKKIIHLALVPAMAFVAISCSGDAFDSYKKSRDTTIIPGPVEDRSAPNISSATAVEADRVRVVFSEELDPVSAAKIENYHIQGVNRVVVKNIEMNNEKTVDLVLWTDRAEHRMKSGIRYTLLVQNVADTSENAISYKTSNFDGRGWVIAGLSADVASITNSDSINVTVAGENIVGYQYSIDNGAWSQEYSISQPISVTGLTEGAHELRVVGKHTDGSWQEINYSSKLNWNVDLTPPEIRIGSAPDSVTDLTDVSFTFGGTGVAAWRYLLESDDLLIGGSWSEETSVSESLSLEGLDAGTYTISIIGKDTAGNWQAEADAATYTFRIIEEGQVVVTLTGLPDEKTNRDSASVTVGGVNSYYYVYSIDGGDWSNLRDLFEPIELESLSEGSHTLRVRGADFAGEVQPEEEAAQYTWTIDSIAPTALLENLPAVESCDRSIYVSVTGAGVVKYRYRLDGSAWSGYYEVSDAIEINSLNEGSHTLEVSGVDEFGNEQKDQSSATAHTWTIDLSAPEAALTGTPPALSNNDSVSITVGGTDVVGYKYRLDTGIWSGERAISEVISLSGLSETSHQLRVIGRDAAGNWQAIDAPTTVTWTVDATPPAASLSNVPASTTSQEDISVIVGGPGVVAYKYSLDLAPASDAEWDVMTEYSIATPIENSSPLSETEHNLYVIARDAAGNWQTNADRTVLTWTVDTSIPEAVLTGTPAKDSKTKETDASITVSGDGITYYRYRMEYEQEFSETIEVGTGISVTGLSEGDHTLYVIGFKSSSTTWQTDPTEYSWTVDLTPPAAELGNRPNDVTNSTDISITVEGIGVVAYKYSLDYEPADDVEWTGMSEYDASVPVTSAALAEGAHVLYVIARDEAGNWQTNANRTSYTWTVNTSSAVAEVTNIPDTDNDDSNGYLTSMSSADIVVGPLTLEGYKYRYSTDGSAPDGQAWSEVLPVEQHIVLDSGVLPSKGTVILQVVGKDIYGNWQDESSPTSVTWEIDSTRPVAKLTGLPDAQTMSAELDAAVGTEDGSAEVVSYKYKIDDGEWQDGGDFENGFGISTHIEKTGLDDGYHRLYVIAKSVAGVWQSFSGATTYTWKVDSSAPTAVLLNAPENNGDTTQTSINITVGGDGVVAYKSVVNDASPDWESLPESDVTSTINQSGLVQGSSYSLRVIARDSIGNWQTIPTLLEWDVVYIQAPQVNSSRYVNSLLVPFTWDNPADTGNVEIQVAGAKTDGTADFDNPLYQAVIGNVENYNYIADTEANGSRYFARVKVQDTSGNWSLTWGAASSPTETAGSVSGLVRDTDDNDIGGATITLRYMDDNSVVQTNAETPEEVTVTTGSDGRFVIENVPAGTNRYRLVCEIDDRSIVKNNVTVVAGENTDVGALYIVPSGAAAGDITGKVVDANTAEVIQGAVVTVQSWDISTGTFTVAGTDTTDSNGDYSITGLSAGTYTVIITNDNYFDLTVDNQVINGNLNMGRQAICEILAEPQVRVIVLWGATPADLDLHLVGPTVTGDSDTGNPTDRFHVYWSNHKTFDEYTGNYIAGDGGSWSRGDTTGTMSTASLVQDITAANPGYGPEAINLYRHGNTQYARGVYTFTVDNWSETEWVPAGYSITMRVYDAIGMAREINFPTTGWSGASPNFWKAIKIDIQGVGRSNRTIHVVNQFADLSYGSKESMDW